MTENTEHQHSTALVRRGPIKPRFRARVRAAWNEAAWWAEQELVPWLLYALAPWLGRRGRDIQDAVTGGWEATAFWLKTLAITALAATAVPILVLLIEGGLAGGAALQHLFTSRHGIAATITNPVNAFLAQHTASLPVSAGTVGLLWEVVGGGMLVAAFFGSTIARLLWTVWGAATGAMVWLATADPGRPVAVAIAATVWGVFSLFALHGLNLRPTFAVDATVRNGSATPTWTGTEDDETTTPGQSTPEHAQ